MTPRSCLAAHCAAILAFALGLWGWHSTGWFLAAQSAPPQKKTAKADPAKVEGVLAAAPKGQQGIMVVVNDEAITAYDIEQRARFLGLGANVGEKAKESFERIVKDEGAMRALQEEVVRANPGKSKDELVAIIRERLRTQAFDSARAVLFPKLRKDAKEDLIDERLRLQSAKKHGIEVTDDDIKAYLKLMADRNKMTYEQFAQHLKGMSVDIATMGEKFRAEKAWRELISRRYAAQVSVTQRDVDRVLSTAAIEAGQDTVELQVHRISLALSGKGDQPALTKRYAEAEALRRRFGGCKTMGELAKSAPDGKFEDMKYVKPSSIAEPMRSMLLSAKDDEALPPLTTSGGVELYAVCGRRSVAGNDAQRVKAMQELQSKELEILARRHMRNLRQEANIERK